MITKIKVSNYRSIGQNTIINLGRLNVFVGQNGSGKSNIVDIIRFISDIMRIGLEGALNKRHGIKAVRRWSSGKPLNVFIHLEIKNKEMSGFYEFEIASDKKHDYVIKDEKASITTNGIFNSFTIRNQMWINGPVGIRPNITPTNLVLPIVSGDDRFKPLVDFLKNMDVYNIYPDNLRKPQIYDPVKPMEEQGHNWVSILKDQKEDSWKPELIAALGKLTNDIDDIEIKQLSGYLISKFRHGFSGKSKKAKWFESAQESDGTLRIAGILTAMLQSPHLSVIGIEEPELTIHPGAIPLILDFINQTKKTSQVLITTHSPDLLDCLPDGDVIRVVDRSNSVTTVGPLISTQLDAVRKGLFSLGEIHRSEGLRSRQLSLFFK